MPSTPVPMSNAPRNATVIAIRRLMVRFLVIVVGGLFPVYGRVVCAHVQAALAPFALFLIWNNVSYMESIATHRPLQKQF
jgi:hypothetical protein